MVLRRTLLEGPLPLRWWMRHTFTNDIKDINQDTSSPQVMNKQAKVKKKREEEDTKNIAWPQISGCMPEGGDTDGTEKLRLVPLKKNKKIKSF